ncbi:PepSY domain-containing protein [Terrisporobacter mayombei]|uniref:PepSY domain-containing protein n=1 Tax=Terrisporobacter mayombei TaxID=1541 RepID=A0ABY9PYT1_9FIRM|nr:PepSY domain-containing protein [Terrisporobacter mayombei]MCC3866636.1 PepSY domain-containing protein [Terrisporobacter mayombei]WMT80870.1 hypothetical protein TEMA_11920 [Terrisporobacter mayombei]
MRNTKDKIVDFDKKAVIKKAKKVIIITLSCLIILGGAGAYVGYSYIKSNIHYTESQCENIALEKVPGKIIKVKKDIDKESLSLAYDFEIKGNDNVLNKVEVDSKSGAIIDIHHADFRNDDHRDKFERD